jgi:hypothetical protein
MFFENFKMKTFFLTMLLLLLVSCGPLPSQITATAAPIQTNTPTSTPTMTPIPTIESTPTATPLPAEFGQDGLPVFPKITISKGDGFEIAFSQGILNALGAQSIIFPSDVMDDLKQALVGQWFWETGINSYHDVNPLSVESLREANDKNPGIPLKLGKQRLPKFGPRTRIRIDILRGSEEYEALKDHLSSQEAGQVYTYKGTGNIYPTGTPMTFVYAEEDLYRFIFYVNPSFIDHRKNDAYSAVGLIFWPLANESAWAFRMIAIDNKIFKSVRDRPTLSTVGGDKLYVGGLYDGVGYNLGRSFINKEAILGGCDYGSNDGYFSCVPGTEKWNFRITEQ